MVQRTLDEQEGVFFLFVLGFFFLNLIWYIMEYYVTVLLRVVAGAESLPVGWLNVSAEQRLEKKPCLFDSDTQTWHLLFMI